MQPFPNTVVELTQALIQIPSVNPDGEPGTSDTGEQACAEYVASFLASIGAIVELEEVLPGRPNVIGRFPTNPASDGKPKPRILFGPHTDTVSVSGMTIPPFGGEVSDARVWGRGASDTKGPMASMLWALRELRDEIADLPVEVHFVGFMSEESSQHGSRHFAEHHPDYDFALIGEPTSLKTVLKHKGCLWADIITSGVAVHGATPELGVNAIIKMARIVEALDSEFRKELVEVGGVDALLGASTINIGIIHGGTRSNIVADRCTLRVDIRMTPELCRKGGAMPLLKAFVERCEATFTSAKGGVATVVEPLPEAPPLDTDEANPFVQALVGAGAKVTGAPWFCDAAYLATAGIPAIAIGPGSIAQAHTKDEWIRVADLEEGAAFFAKFLKSL